MSAFEQLIDRYRAIRLMVQAELSLPAAGAISAIAMCLMVAIALPVGRRFGRAVRDTRMSRRKARFAAFLSGAILGVVFYLTMIALAVAAIFTRRYASKIETVLDDSSVLLPMAIVGAYTLYMLRGRARFAYGLIEIGVGSFASALAAQATLTALSTRLLALATGIYIIVRGLDNCRQGLPTAWCVRWDRLFFHPSPTRLSRQGNVGSQEGDSESLKRPS